MDETESLELTRDGISGRRAAPPRRGRLRRVLALLLTVAAVLGLTAMAARYNLSSLDSIRRLLMYNKVNSTDSRVRYVYDSDRTNRFALLGDCLIVASTTRFSVLKDDGTSIYSRSVHFSAPAIAVGGKTAAIYDVGGTALYLVGETGFLRDMSDISDNALVGVRLNSSDYLTVATEKSGYKSAVSVYDPDGTVLFSFNSSNSYVIDAAATEDGKTVHIALLGGHDGTVSTTVQQYALHEKASKQGCVLDDALLLELGSLASATVAVTDKCFAALSSDGSLAGACEYSYPYLRGYTLGGSDFGALLLSRYRSGNTGRIVTVGMNGNTLATKELTREVLSISACGRYLAVLCTDGLTVYNSELSECAVLSDTHYAGQVLARKDGTVVMLGAGNAWLYIP